MEFALVTAAFLCMLAAGSLMWKTVSGGLLTEHALVSASHHVRGVLGWVTDIFSY